MQRRSREVTGSFTLEDVSGSLDDDLFLSLLLSIFKALLRIFAFLKVNVNFTMIHLHRLVQISAYGLTPLSLPAPEP